MKHFYLTIFIVLTVSGLFAQQLRDITPEKLAQFERHLELAEIAMRSNDFKTQAINLSQAAFILMETNRLYEAVDVFTQAAAIFNKLNDLQNLRNIYSNLGLLYADLQDINQATKYFNECLKISRSTGEQNYIASGLYDLAFLSTSSQRYDDSNSKLQEALKVAIAINDSKQLLNIYGLYAMNYRMLNDPEQAAMYQDKYATTLRMLQQQSEREVYQQREIKNIAELKRSELEILYQIKEVELARLIHKGTQDSLARIAEETQTQLLRIDNLEKEAQLQEARIKEQQLQQKLIEDQQRQYIMMGVGVLIAIVIVSGILLRNNIYRKGVNKKLKKFNVELIEKGEKLNKALGKIENQNEQIRKSINYAKGIQKAMVPPTELLNDFFEDSFILWKPRDVVSGDFYWYKPLYNNPVSDTKETHIFADKDLYDLRTADKLLIAAVDCTGHGVPGAFMSMIGNSLLDEITQFGITRPDLILKNLKTGINTTLKQNTTKNKDGMDISICLIDKRAKKLYFSGANSPLFYIKENKPFYIKGDSISIGGSTDTDSRQNFKLHEINLDSTVHCYLFSDGYVDQFGGQLERKFLISNFRNFLFEIHEQPFEEQANLLDVAFYGWMDEIQTQIDDVLVMGFKI